MSLSVTLTDRQQHILWATVRHYITTAEPVGSKALVEEYNLSVSPATIRNAMGALEKIGLLYQPHTSAGRIPSDSGYRIYVDHLITPSQQLSRQAEQAIGSQLRAERWSLEVLLRRSAQLLSTLSGYIALITTPQTSSARLHHLQLLLLDSNRLMLVIVTDTYETRSVLMTLPELLESEEQASNPELIEHELQVLSNFLNSRLRGCSLADLATLDWQAIDQQFSHYADFLRQLMAEVLQSCQPSESIQILVSGVSEVLRQPEFSELHQVQALLHLLEEEQEQVGQLIFDWQQAIAPKQQSSDRRVTIRIGAENPLEPMRTCALVSTTYQRGNLPVGSVGLLGPTRMMYENAIAFVEATADFLSDALSG
ncbi:MAG: heat-inducible transcriptional repressor HrcA [Cyanobacteria bacterium]|nr:heat-inducible transcriptional repressor HrcA [Cyanobacteriota bacterium]MDW8201224.1 heat-inducible transcriptional repressor HrcA [Cyanobacteriota bacterium SKYGB_h_bin112]